MNKRPKSYNTSKRSHVIMARLTAEEKADFDERIANVGMSQQDYVKQMCFCGKIKPVIHVSQALDEAHEMSAMLGKTCGLLSQIAKHYNRGGAQNPVLEKQLSKELLDRGNAEITLPQRE